MIFYVYQSTIGGALLLRWHFLLTIAIGYNKT